MTKTNIDKIKKIYNNWWFTDITTWEKEGMTAKIDNGANEGELKNAWNVKDGFIKYPDLIVLLSNNIKDMLREEKEIQESYKKDSEDYKLSLGYTKEYERDIKKLERLMR